MMDWLIDIDWTGLIVPQVSVLEIILRGSVMYLALFLLFRLVLKRESGAVGITDLLVVVLIADAAQNAMAAEYTSLTDGLLLVATIIFWAYALDWLGYRVPFVQRLVHPRPLPLITDGRLHGGRWPDQRDRTRRRHARQPRADTRLIPSPRGPATSADGTRRNPRTCAGMSVPLAMLRSSPRPTADRETHSSRWLPPSPTLPPPRAARRG